MGLNCGFDLGDEGGFINFFLEYCDVDGINWVECDIGGLVDVLVGMLFDEVCWG